MEQSIGHGSVLSKQGLALDQATWNSQKGTSMEVL